MQFKYVLIILTITLLLNILIISSINLRSESENKSEIINIAKLNLISFNPPPTSFLTEHALSRISTPVNSLKYGADYLVSEKYIDEQDEYNMKNYMEYNYDNEQCIFNRQRFMEHLNMIRFKHQVPSMRYDLDLENQAKIFALKIKKENKCKFPKDERRMYISEAFYDGEERLTEKELLQKWYRPAYFNYNFVNVTHNLTYDTVKNYPMALLLWDTVSQVGCAKVCCETRELNLCHFLPILVDPNVLEMKKHIKNNKFIIGTADGPKNSNRQ
jgi:hypothetical protein